MPLAGLIAIKPIKLRAAGIELPIYLPPIKRNVRYGTLSHAVRDFDNANNPCCAAKGFGFKAL